jgi:hypothetical protein
MTYMILRGIHNIQNLKRKPEKRRYLVILSHVLVENITMDH